MSLALVWQFLWTVALAASPALGEEPKVERACTITMQFGWFAAQEVSLKGDRVIGSNFNVQREGDVVYGFVHGEPTRFRALDDRVSGTVAGMDLMLYVARDAIKTEVSGLVGERRVTARVTDTAVTVSARGASLSLSHYRGNHLKGQMLVASDLGPADLVLFGCELKLIRERPDLIVILFMWWLGG